MWGTLLLLPGAAMPGWGFNSRVTLFHACKRHPLYMLIKLHCASREAIWRRVKILLKGGPSFIRVELRKCLKPQVTEDLVSWIIFTGDSVKPQVWVKLHNIRSVL